MSESFIEGVDPLSLQSFEEEGYSDEDALRLAQGHLIDAVPHLQTIYPTLSPEDKLLAKYAVLEMALFIKNDFENFDRATSPFQSETIGSYSYNKMAQTIRMRESTGIPAFDRAVDRFAQFATSEDGAAISSVTEVVFAPGFNGYLRNREGVQPFNPWSSDWRYLRGI